MPPNSRQTANLLLNMFDKQEFWLHRGGTRHALGLWLDQACKPPCGDTWVCQVMIAIKEIRKALACTAKKRSRLIKDRSDRP